MILYNEYSEPYQKLNCNCSKTWNNETIVAREQSNDAARRCHRAALITLRSA